MPKILYLLDGHAIAYRAYFALTSGGSTRWATSSGEPTAGIYGFANMLLKLLEQEEPDYLAVSFDTGKTFRHEMYPEYKGTRAKMPDDLRAQIERIREMVDCFNIPRIEVENYEADDVIGSLATWATTKEGLGVKIVTGDRDLLQLVNNRIVVSLPNPKSGQTDDYFAEDVKARLGVLPEQVVDYKALLGDTSDNIPGVKGVGEKTAVKLLKQYGNLDNIYAHLSEIPGKVGRDLAAGKESAYLSRDLARIRTDLPVTLDLDQAKPNRFDPLAVEKLFHQLEFRTLTQRLKKLNQRLKPSLMPQLEQESLFGSESAPTTPKPDQPLNTDFETVVVDSLEKLTSCVADLNAASTIAFDTETTGVNPLQDQLVGISLSGNPERGYYFPVGHDKGQQLPLDDVLSALKPLLTNPEIAKIAHNAKYDLLVLRQVGVEVSPITFDTMLAEWLITPDSRHLGLKALAWVRLGVDMTLIEDLIGKGKSQITMAQVPIAEAAPYAAADAVVTLRLMPLLEADLQSRGVEKLNHEIEVKLIPVLADMEEAGILLDLPFFERFSQELAQEIRQLEQTIYQQAGEEFNINSTQKLSDVLFKKLALDPPDITKKTSTGRFSTAAGVLEEMKGIHPIIELILNYRELTKLQSTYVDALPHQVNPKTGRVHTTFNQTGTVTGRIASQNPNLQNIPTRTDLGRRVRQGFIAAPGKKLLAVDYSQIELRIVAHIAQDKAMMEAFHKGQDIHAATAAAIYDVPIEQVSKQQRRHAKAINFGLIYGMSPFGLTRATDLTLAEAENFVKEYFKEFPGVKAWLDKTRVEAAQTGSVETLLGRKRYFPNLKAGTNFVMRQREEREAINAPIQGTAADIIKIAMVRMPDALRSVELKAQMLLQVHDELIFEVPDAEIEKTVKVVKDVMEHALELSVPLVTEARLGSNWGELEKVDEEPVVVDLEG